MKLIPLLCLLTACTYTGTTLIDYRSIYESNRQVAEMKCERQPADARERCLAGINKESYDDYRKRLPQ
ncbi:MAG: hypothetical protein WAO71_11470 [Gallionella sp.]